MSDGTGEPVIAASGEKWDAAVRQAADDAPANLEAAVKSELACLWGDLDQAVHYALRGGWSVQCDWITTRLVQLSRLAGATPWSEVPITLVLDGTYQGVLMAAGIAFSRPGEGDMRVMREWRDGQEYVKARAG